MPVIKELRTGVCDADHYIHLPRLSSQHLIHYLFGLEESRPGLQVSRLNLDQFCPFPNGSL